MMIAEPKEIVVGINQRMLIPDFMLPVFAKSFAKKYLSRYI